MSPHGLPQVVECRERGRHIGKRNLDIVIRGGDVDLDLRIAGEFGRRKVPVRIWMNWDVYRVAQFGGAAQVSRKRDRIPLSQAPFQTV